MAYYVDESKVMDFESIQQQDFTAAPNKKSFSHYDTHLWLKVEVSNQSAKQQVLYLHHQDAYRLKQITFYETQNNVLLNSFDINLSNDLDRAEMYGTAAIYKFTLEQNQTKTIYIQATSFIYQYYKLALFDEKHSAQYLVSSHLIIVIVLSILTGLMLYHFILYLMTFFKEYLYYSLYLFFNVTWGSYEYGLLGKYFGWYGEVYAVLHFIVIFSIISLGLFIKSVFQMPKFYPTENRFINIMIIMLIMNFSYILINPYEILFIFIIVMNIVAIMYMGVIISLYRKKAQFISYVIFAQIWLIIFGYTALVFYQGFIDYNFWTRNSWILGIFVDTFAFSYLLSHRIKTLQEENKKSKYKSKRLEALSELLENISHQWRQPLTRINASVMRIGLEMKKNKMSNVNIDKKLNDIEELSVYLSKTIDDFKSLYNKDRTSKLFNLRDAIESSIEMIQSDFQKNRIEVTVEVSHDIYLNSYVNEFQQVLQVIFNNAQDALISNDTQNPHVLIVSEKRDKEVYLQISNNGGEIDPAFIGKIFDAHFSTKQKGEGIGLFMSQKIVKELMDATLTCHNIPHGVCFEMVFKL
ncbi:MAG TPA: hypothetical protein ENK82_06415 [Campylobacterales bacterium]|nr:hypothetical protein [Campylobacterales bacterium]HHS92963.1 hypothetical protein [Campylobacterales bacterium]